MKAQGLISVPDNRLSTSKIIQLRNTSQSQNLSTLDGFLRATKFPTAADVEELWKFWFTGCLQKNSFKPLNLKPLNITRSEGKKV